MEDKTKPTRRKFLTALGTTAAVSVAGCSGESESTSDSGSSNDSGSSDGDSSGSSEDDGGSVDILSHELSEGDFGWEVNGEVQNNTGEEQSYIEVSVQFYDEEGTRIDEWLDNAEDVADGETVAFTVTATTDEEVSDYDIEASASAF